MPLSVTKIELTSSNVSTEARSRPPTTHWRLPHILASSTPPLGSLLLDYFMRLDRSDASEGHRRNLLPVSAGFKRTPFAFADFTRGSDKSSLVASNRFEPTPEQNDDSTKQGGVKITLSHIHYNPITGEHPLPSWLVENALPRRVMGYFETLAKRSGHGLRPQTRPSQIPPSIWSIRLKSTCNNTGSYSTHSCIRIRKPQPLSSANGFGCSQIHPFSQLQLQGFWYRVVTIDVL